MKLNQLQLKQLATQIYRAFNCDIPPADQIFVPLERIKQDREVMNTFYATVRFVVEFCGRKTNTINIKFNVDESGKFLENTWAYV